MSKQILRLQTQNVSQGLNNSLNWLGEDYKEAAVDLDKINRQIENIIYPGLIAGKEMPRQKKNNWKGFLTKKADIL